MSKVTQVTLSKRVSDTNTKYMTTWVDSDSRLKPNASVVLKGIEGEWKLQKVYGTQDRHEVDNRGWDNNNYDKHDGTSMKKRLGK